jgi:hypothetical protein
MIRLGTYSPGSQTDILVMYLSSPSSYGIRLHSSCCGASPRLAGVGAMRTDVVFGPETITSTEYDELAALRKAQAWGTPMFQREHPQYAVAIARLEHLESRVLAANP